MDRQTLLQGLNQDLSHEYAAIIQYTTYAASVAGIHRQELKEFFLTEIQDELRHAQLLADKIAALGGEPTTLPAPVPAAKSAREMLEAVREAEAQTIARYVQRMKEAESLGDFGLSNDLQEIISEETRHKEETEKLLRGKWQE
ncbi:Ferritin Dps family protein [Allomeiothermus silvanus DSM 9946]|uniref:Ferritin Dps family protein n=1 Tax=Allomeiothermus silvanus (strain ATCC 700542 / DSM 9946 / NBRC 106475 / NCIMB 13440 / VI-R2) TaxID=526227 RepID=D7BI81_ALLS1|nr:ferritin-like domain-containing protein [Allomeiothermus silvanus]ADH62355.1 Ferritin Dps family protein [Allomeiothermus silvanus DSM 9946]